MTTFRYSRGVIRREYSRVIPVKSDHAAVVVDLRELIGKLLLAGRIHTCIGRMVIEDEEVRDFRAKAWDNAIHAEGTREVFSRRFNSLYRLTRIRDWLAFAVPILLAFTATAEWLEAEPAAKKLMFGILGAAVAAQLLLALWSLISRWDDNLAYCSRAMRDSYNLKEAWKKIGRNDVLDIRQEYRMRQSQQENIDSHDVQQNISPKEKQIGLRAGLIEVQRKCICGNEPKSRNVPFWPRSKCIHCGGN